MSCKVYFLEDICNDGLFPARSRNLFFQTHDGSFFDFRADFRIFYAKRSNCALRSCWSASEAEGCFKAATNSVCAISAGVSLRKPDFSNHRRIGATLTPELELHFKGFRVGFEVVFNGNCRKRTLCAQVPEFTQITLIRVVFKPERCSFEHHDTPPRCRCVFCLGRTSC